jgi:putative Holliday junction resolvase
MPPRILLLIRLYRDAIGWAVAGSRYEPRSDEILVVQVSGGWVSEAAVTRYLALDVGSKRIGIAVSDELGLTAQPVLTLERRRNQREDLRSIARLCRRFGVAGVVVGNPLKMSGEISTQAAKVQAFAEELGELAGLPIHLWDERLTTHEAHQMLYEAGHARQDHRRLVDQVAATLILQSFLDRQTDRPAESV